LFATKKADRKFPGLVKRRTGKKEKEKVEKGRKKKLDPHRTFRRNVNHGLPALLGGRGSPRGKRCALPCLQGKGNCKLKKKKKK